MDLNFSSCSRGTEDFSIFNSAENRLRNASRWSMASAAMTPRESETASSLFRLPGDSLTRILLSEGRLTPNRKCQAQKALLFSALFHHYHDISARKIVAAY